MYAHLQAQQWLPGGSPRQAAISPAMIIISATRLREGPVVSGRKEMRASQDSGLSTRTSESSLSMLMAP